MGLPEGTSERHLKSIMAGNTVLIDGGTYTKADLSPEDLAKAYVGAENLENAEAEARRILGAQLEEAGKRIAELEAQVAGFESQPQTITQGEVSLTVHGDLFEDLMPKSKSALEQKSEELVVKIAKYRGIETEGKDKAALIVELLAKPEDK